MLVNWAYVKRDTFFHRLDPRARVIFMLCAIVALGFIPGGGTGFWDVRIVLFFFVLSYLQIIVARISWKQMRRFWLVITIITLMLSLVTLLTGRGRAGVYEQEHMLWAASLNVFGGPLTFRLSAERLAYLVTQILRILTFAALSLVIPYTIDPTLYGAAFKGLGDKVAYAMDLAFRFIPTLGRDAQTIMDAQRARGFEMDSRERAGVLQKIRNFAPLLIPLTIGSVMQGEEIVDAMDLRAFGTGPRTWLPKLRYRAIDILYMAFGFLIVAASIVLKQAGFGGLWVPPWLTG
jgi:energy-coupling factor transport system permease protein